MDDTTVGGMEHPTCCLGAKSPGLGSALGDEESSRNATLKSDLTEGERKSLLIRAGSSRIARSLLFQFREELSPAEFVRLLNWAHRLQLLRSENVDGR